MTIKELNKQIDLLEAQTADMPETNLRERMEKRRLRTVWLAPSEMPHTIRPIAIKANWEILDINGDEVEINFDKARKFMHDIFPVDTAKEYTSDEHAYREALQKTIRTMRYGIERLYEVDPDSNERRAYWRASVNAQDFIVAWEIAWANAKKGVKSRRRHEKTTTDITAMLGDTQLDITYKKYEYALTPRRNPDAYIIAAPAGFIQAMQWTDKGLLKFTDDTTIPEGTGEPYDISFLRQIFTAAYASRIAMSEDTITVDLPKFCKKMGIDYRIENTDDNANDDDNASEDDNNTHRNDILQKIQAFDKLLGVVDNGDIIAQVLHVSKYVRSKQTLTLVTPYMNLLLERISADMKQDKHYPKQLKPGDEPPEIIAGYYNYLIHASIVSERNKVAVELAIRIMAKILQYGYDNKEYKYRTKFSSIIKLVQPLQQRLNDTQRTADKNKVLRRTFACAYKLLRTKTDLYQFLTNLNIPEVIPTTTTLDKLLIATHHGRNRNYKGKFPVSNATLQNNGELS